MKFFQNQKIRGSSLIAILFLGACQFVICKAEIPASNTEIRSSPDDSSDLLPADGVEFQKLIDQTYDFKPKKLTEAQQTAKSAEMDKVWKNVKADPKALVPCLRRALDAPTVNSFFRFDGSTLLFDIDKSEESKRILIRSYAKADLDEIDLRYWVTYILRFGLEGLDTSAAGEAWLNAENPGYYLPQHGTLKVDKAIGALAIFGSMDETFATPSLVTLALGHNQQDREMAVGLLLDQATPEAFHALKNLDQKALSDRARTRINDLLTKPKLMAARKGKPKITREQFLEAFTKMTEGNSEMFIKLTVDVTDGEKDAIAVLKKEDIPLVRKARRFMASTGTPHIPEWYKSFTDILMAMVWDHELIA